MNFVDRYLLIETKHKKMPFWQKNLEVVGRKILNEHIMLWHSLGAGHWSSYFMDCVFKTGNVCLLDERTWIFRVHYEKSPLGATLLTGNTVHSEHKYELVLFMSWCAAQFGELAIIVLRLCLLCLQWVISLPLPRTQSLSVQFQSAQTSKRTT